MINLYAELSICNLKLPLIIAILLIIVLILTTFNHISINVGFKRRYQKIYDAFLEKA